LYPSTLIPQIPQTSNKRKTIEYTSDPTSMDTGPDPNDYYPAEKKFGLNGFNPGHFGSYGSFPIAVGVGGKTRRKKRNKKRKTRRNKKNKKRKTRKNKINKRKKTRKRFSR